MFASASRCAARSTATHSHRTAPEISSRSTIFQPVPKQFGQTAGADITPPLSSPRQTFGLFDGGQHRARVYAVVFPDFDRGHPPVARRFHFVLHLHRFHHDNALSGDHFVTHRDHHPHHLTRHRRDD